MSARAVTKTAAIIVVVIVLAAVAAWLVSAPPPKEPQRSAISSSVGPQEGVFEYTYADFAGIFRKEGVDVNIIPTRTSDESILLLLKGEVDFSTDVAAGIEAGIRGEPIKVLFVGEMADHVVVAQSRINSLKEAEAIGVVGQSIDDLLLQLELKEQGIVGSRQRIRYMVNYDALLKSIQEGSLQAAVMRPSLLPKLPANSKILLRLGAKFPLPLLGLVTREDLIRTKPQSVASVVKSIYLSELSLLDNKQSAVRTAVNVFGLNLSLARFLYEVRYDKIYGGGVIVPNIPLNSIELFIEAKSIFYDTPKIPAQSIIDSSFIAKVKGEILPP